MQIKLFFISIQRSFWCFIVAQSGHTFAHGAAFGPNGCRIRSPFQSRKVLVSGARAKICLLTKRHAFRPVFLHRFCDFKKNISEKEADHSIRAGRTALPARFIHRPIASTAFAAMQGLLCSSVPHDGAVGNLEDAVPERMRKFRVVRDDDDELLAGELL